MTRKGSKQKIYRQCKDIVTAKRSFVKFSPFVDLQRSLKMLADVHESPLHVSP